MASYSHSSRSWSDSGVHYTVETATFSRPSMSSGSMPRHVQNPLGHMFGGQAGYQYPHAQQQPLAGSNALGGAFGLLNDVLSMQRQHAALFRGSPPQSSRQPRMEDADDDDGDGVDEDLAYGSADPATHRFRSVFSRIKDRLLENGRRRTRLAPYSRQSSPDPIDSSSRSKEPSRPRKLRTEVRQPSWGQATDALSDGKGEPDRHQPRTKRSENGAGASQSEMVEALERTVEHEKREYSRAKRRFQQASQRTLIDSVYMQSLLDNMKSAEMALASAVRSLEEAREKARNLQSERRPRTSAGHSNSRYTSARTVEPDPFEAWMAGSFGAFHHNSPLDPIFQVFEDFGSCDPFAHTNFGTFNRLFTDPGLMFGMPADETAFHPFRSGAHTNKRARFSAADAGRPYSTYDATPQNPAHPRCPPPTILRPEEAKQLFKTYVARWNALAPTDPNIPYPARGLQAADLTNRDSIWAPLVYSRVSTWSEETVMQANTQAFFLNAVGLAPVYTEAGSSIAMSFDKRQASVAQVKELIDVLKKEKIRWHSDRLGRRNGGLSGPNEALQRDTKARAVFHGVCGLMESALQG